jgi:hypothetical protein
MHIIEARSNYVDPKTMPDKCVNAPPAPVIMRAEEVVPKHMMFGHGIRESFDKAAGKHFVTMNQLTLGTHERTDEVLKQSSVSMESGVSPNIKSMTKFINTSRDNERSMYVTTNSEKFTVPAPAHDAPKKTTSQTFTKQFRAGIPNLRS